MSRKKLIQIIQVLLMEFIKLDKETSKLIDDLSKIDSFINFYPYQNVEVFPINELVKVLKIEEEKRDQFVDEALKLSEEKIAVKYKVKKFMKKYML